MKDILQIAINYIEGKDVYPQIRKSLSQVFLICLCTNIYIKIYGKFQWYSISDYKAIIDFIVQGKFIVPFCIYLIVLFIVRCLELSIFYFLTHFKANKIHRLLQEKQLTQPEVRYALNLIYQASKRVTPINLTKELIVQVVHENKIEIEDMITKLSANTSIVKEKFEVNFNLLFRATLLLITLNLSIPNMTLLLLCISLIILITCMYLLVKAFHIVEIAPTFISKYYQGLLSHHLNASQFSTINQFVEEKI